VATTDMGQKQGRGAAVPLSRGELGPRLTQCGRGRGLLPYQVASSSRQPFGHNRHGPKTGIAPFKGGVPAATPCNTTSPGPRFTSVPSGILIHPTVWPQQAWAKSWVGLCPFWGSCMGPHRTQSRLGRGLPPYQVASYSIQPFRHNVHWPKIGGCALLGRGNWVPI